MKHLGILFRHGKGLKLSSYKSPGYSNENISKQNSSAIEENILQASTPYFTSPPKRQLKSWKQEIDPEICRICHVTYENPANIETDNPWLNCAKECNWWVHVRCVGVFYENSDRGEKQLDSWTKDHYFWRKHMSVAKPVGWDLANQCETIVAQQKKTHTQTNTVYLKNVLKRKVLKAQSTSPKWLLLTIVSRKLLWEYRISFERA